MTVNYTTDLNIYFHMKNHYKKLRNVKSAIDNSPPKGFTKSSPTPPNTVRSIRRYNYEDGQSKNYCHLPTNSSTVKRHNCISSASTKSDTSVRSISLPPRPTTRRYPHEIPQQIQHKYRSQSVGPARRKVIPLSRGFSNTKLNKKKTSRKKKKMQDNGLSQRDNNSVVVHEDESQSDGTSTTNRSSKQLTPDSERTKMKSKSEEHEYLQFILRITEDIIINNLYRNQDIEKVFQNHIEANKDRLKMKKMEAHLSRLCKELNIPYKNQETLLANGNCYQQFFENSSPVFNSGTQTLNNCECTSKRYLEVGIKNNREVIETDGGNNELEYLELDNRNTNFDILNKHSLGRVTECTEPTNSEGTLANSTKHPSVTTVSSLGNIENPHFFDNVNNKENDVSVTKEKEPVILDIFNTEPALTEKEKLDCIAEEIIYKKKNDHSIIHEETNNQTNEHEDINIEKTEDKESENSTTDTNKNSFETTDIVNVNDKFLEKEKTLIDTNEVQNSINEIFQLNPSVCAEIQKRDEIVFSTENKQKTIHENKVTYDKFTQINVYRCDKQCNTSAKLNECFHNDDYILINGPVYILKSVLNSEKNYVVCDNETVEDKPKCDAVQPEKLPLERSKTFVKCIGANSEQKYDYDLFYIKNNNFSKLMSSDYDLTPQRDENTSEKYHHLLTDVSTSTSNVISINNTNVDKNLLLTDKYTLNNNQEETKFKNSKTVQGALTNSPDRGEIKDCLLSSNVDRRYEITSYTMPKQKNNLVKSTNFYGSGDTEMESLQLYNESKTYDISIDYYKVNSESVKINKKLRNRDDKNMNEHSMTTVFYRVNGDSDEENSQMSTTRSEMEDSNKSPSKRKNFLGKRKLKRVQ